LRKYLEKKKKQGIIDTFNHFKLFPALLIKKKKTLMLTLMLWPLESRKEIGTPVTRAIST